LKKLTEKYELEDDKIRNALKYEIERIKKEKRDAFVKYLEDKEKEWIETKAERVALLGFDEDYPNDMEYEEVVEEETVLDTKEVSKWSNCLCM